jgi:hypothetical protein
MEICTNGEDLQTHNHANSFHELNNYKLHIHRHHKHTEYVSERQRDGEADNKVVERREKEGECARVH